MRVLMLHAVVNSQADTILRQLSLNVKTADFSNILDTQTGTLIGVPIPQEHEARAAKIQKAAEQAVAEAQENGIARRGKEVTPWILARVKELSGGESVESSEYICFWSRIRKFEMTDGPGAASDIALIENNARVGAAIAVELAKIKASGETGPPQVSSIIVELALERHSVNT